MDRKLLLLGLLRGQEMHGYQLYEFLERYLNTCTDIKKPTAYYLLNKMAQDGWLEEDQVQDGNRPARKVYHLTAEGEAQFQRLLRNNLIDITPVEFAGNIGIAFLDSLDSYKALEYLKQRYSVFKKILEQLESAPNHKGSMQIIIEYQIKRIYFELDWLNEKIKGYQKSASLRNEELPGEN
jgi:DNA-binding PadR family transcriptional regulator